MAAIITGIISLVVAVVGIVPTLTGRDKDKPTATPAAVAITVAPSNTQVAIPSPTSTQVPIPTASQQAVGVPTIIDVGPSMTPMPIIGASSVPADDLPTPAIPTTSGVLEPNLRIYFDNASFTIRNQSSSQQPLASVTFFSDEGRWDAW